MASRVGEKRLQSKDGVQHKDVPSEYVEKLYCKPEVSGCG